MDIRDYKTKGHGRRNKCRLIRGNDPVSTKMLTTESKGIPVSILLEELENVAASLLERTNEPELTLALRMEGVVAKLILFGPDKFRTKILDMLQDDEYASNQLYDQVLGAEQQGMRMET